MRKVGEGYEIIGWKGGTKEERKNRMPPVPGAAIC
jgi:hypothetical protein